MSQSSQASTPPLMHYAVVPTTACIAQHLVVVTCMTTATNGAGRGVIKHCHGSRTDLRLLRQVDGTGMMMS